jgi:nucleoside-diphosphate-sugar epimerase
VKVAVVGATGFIGSTVSAVLTSAGHEVVGVSAPRLTTHAESAAELWRVLDTLDPGALAQEFHGCRAVVNSAGVSDAVSGDDGTLRGANALLPLLIQRAAVAAGVVRFVHISSAAVQGRLDVLTATQEYDAPSPYGLSKVLAEQALLRHPHPGLVIYRPTSVHGAERAITQKLARVLSSRWARVAAPGNDATPQVHVRSVAEAVRVLLAADDQPPLVVLHPWEGVTTSSLGVLLTGHEPRQVSRRTAKLIVRVAHGLVHVAPAGYWGQARRVEMLLLGQSQEPGWLDEVAPHLLQPSSYWAETRQQL